MNLLARVRRLLIPAPGRATRRALHDPAEMGTAFGLDAITVFEPETPAEIAGRESAPRPTAFELRLHRRSSF